METLKPLVDSLINLIQNGVNFVKGQIPDVAQQILHFKAAEAWVDLFFPLIVVAVFAALVYFFLKKCKEADYNSEGWGICAILTTIGLGISTIVAFVASYNSIITLIEINYAPKLFLLEYLKAFLTAPK